MERRRGPRDLPLPEHIARVAAELFYREGIHAVGVDRVAASADVTKRTLYRHYRSKEALVAAALRRGPRVRFPLDGEPAERVLGAFRALAAFMHEKDYRGCPHINAAAELNDRRHPGRAVVEELTARRRAWFRERAGELGASDPDLLAEQLDVLFDGALVNAMKRGDHAPVLAALSAAETLLAVSRPRRSPRPASAARARSLPNR